MAGGYLTITPKIIRNLPLSFDCEMDKLVDLVNNINSNFDLSIMDEINLMIYKCYNLNDEDIKYIENFIMENELN